MDVKMKLSEVGLENCEFLAATLIVGLTTLVKENAISIRESEKCLFNPYTSNRLRSMGIDENIVKLICWGSQMGDIKRIIPHKYESSINRNLEEAISIIKQLPRDSLDLNMWVDSENLTDTAQRQCDL